MSGDEMRERFEKWFNQQKKRYNPDYLDAIADVSWDAWQAAVREAVGECAKIAAENARLTDDYDDFSRGYKLACEKTAAALREKWGVE